MKYLIIICFLLVSGLTWAKEISAIQVTDLKCENFNNPLGIENQHPRLSWQLKSDLRNIRQKSYRILVSDELLKIDIDQGNIWDSGKIDSDNSILVSYAGSTLQASKQYFWKVIVWDTNGKASEWSETASWQMGLLTSGDWENAFEKAGCPSFQKRV